MYVCIWVAFYFLFCFLFSQMTDNRMDWQLHKSTLSARFKEMYRLKQWTDCAFSVGEESMQVRKKLGFLFSLLQHV